MADPHILDGTVWSSLHGRQSSLALIHGRAVRFDRAYGVFAATVDESDESLADLAALIAAHGDDLNSVHRVENPQHSRE